MTRSQISNGYFQFGGKIKRWRRTKRKRHVRKKSQRGGAFMAPLVASTFALIATNLINGLIGKIL